jgi:uncharacterized protein (TIRG00374 family)
VRLRLWLGIGVSLVLLWVAFRGVPLDELGRSLREIRPLWLVPVLASILVRFWLTAIRWQVLLGPTKHIGTHRLFAVTLIGFMANNVLPARLGEFVRAYALGRAEALPTSLSFATIVVERVFDGFTLLLFLVVGLSFLDPQPWLVWSAAAAGGLYLAALGVLLALRRPGGAALSARLLDWLPAGLRARVSGLLASFTLGLQVFDDPRALLSVAGLSLLIWLVNVAGVQAMFATFALALPVHAAMLVQAIIAVAIVLPSAPGYVGTFQVATVAALALFAVPEATALSLSLVYHAVNYVPITVVGLIYLSAMNLTLGELRSAGEHAS